MAPLTLHLHGIARVVAANGRETVLERRAAALCALAALEPGFPRERAAAACRRARHFGNFTYGGLKAILRQGLDLHALPAGAPPAAQQPLPHPRFARAITDLLHMPPKEDPDELH